LRLDSIEERQKMMLQQVFQQARSDSGAKVLISMVSHRSTKFQTASGSVGMNMPISMMACHRGSFLPSGDFRPGKIDSASAIAFLTVMILFR
jgi:hypothetical protein